MSEWRGAEREGGSDEHFVGLLVEKRDRLLSLFWSFSVGAVVITVAAGQLHWVEEERKTMSRRDARAPHSDV